MATRIHLGSRDEEGGEAVNYTYLFAGIAVGSIFPWIVMICILRQKNHQTAEQLERANAPTKLLAERNAIGIRQCVAIEQLVETMQLQAPDEIQATGEFMTVRKDSPEHAEYLKARFAEKTSGQFMWKGHRWRYEHTTFDDAGEYDVLWRPADDRAKYENHAKSALVAALKRFDLAYTDEQLERLSKTESGLGEISPKLAQKLIQLRKAIALAERRGE